MIVMAVLLVVTAGLSAFALSTVHRVHRMTDIIRAKAIAEAGANQAYNRLREDYTLIHSPEAFPKTDFSEGSYEIILTPVDDGRTRVVSIGRYGRAEQRVGMVLWDTHHAGIGPDYLNYAITANSDLTFHGTPQDISGSLQSNQEFILSGTPDYDTIDGKVSARNSDDIPESHRTDWEEVTFPTLSDPEFQAFLAEAEATGRLDRRDDDVVISPHDDFDFNGDVVVIDGDLTLRGSGDREFSGLLYVTGNIITQGQGSMAFSGVMLAGGTTTFNGSSDVIHHNRKLVFGQEEEPDPYVVVSAWWD